MFLFLVVGGVLVCWFWLCLICEQRDELHIVDFAFALGRIVSTVRICDVETAQASNAPAYCTLF